MSSNLNATAYLTANFVCSGRLLFRCNIVVAFGFRFRGACAKQLKYHFASVLSPCHSLCASVAAVLSIT